MRGVAEQTRHMAIDDFEDQMLARGAAETECSEAKRAKLDTEAALTTTTILYLLQRAS